MGAPEGPVCLYVAKHLGGVVPNRTEIQIATIDARDLGQLHFDNLATNGTGRSLCLHFEDDAFALRTSVVSDAV